MAGESGDRKKRREQIAQIESEISELEQNYANKGEGQTNRLLEIKKE